jgi:hypothetical protein
MFEVEKKELRKCIWSLRFRNQYETCSTFLRLQEFYESPFRGIRGCVFTLEEYMDRYAQETGNFTYTLDWGGFNVPGQVVRNFFKSFEGMLLEKEKMLYDLLADQVRGSEPFYVIGHYEPDAEWSYESTLAHEVAHGLYHLNGSYKKKMLKLVAEMPEKARTQMENKLLGSGGYCRKVLKDEIHAYLSTSSPEFLKRYFKVPLVKVSKPFKKLFRETIDA